MPRGRVLTKKTEYVECTFGDAREEFYNYNRVKGLAIDTQNAYRTYIEGFARWYGKDKKLSDISPKILEAYANKKIEDGNKPVSVATTMVHLKRFFRFCHSRNYIDEIEIVIPKYEIELKEPYTEEEMNLLLKRPKTNSWVEYRNWVMVNYFYSTGQRLSTVLHIKVKDLNLELQKVKLIWNKDKIQKWMPYMKSDDYHFEVHAKVEISDQFFGWLLGFGKKVKIISPDDTVDQFKSYLDKIRNMY